ncbi:MAG: conjugative transfer protein MobI(A/C) [Pseudomonadota bacterium]|nr:conjugative transfer protein MobI(A/C) [Pseudomonadota bacterium]MDP1904174.1 conjugative transfer protein MobI(A/C) [Pseudomonadota bacterium]
MDNESSETSGHDEAIAALERRIDALHARAYTIVEQHWSYVREMEGRLPGWENKSSLQVRCAAKNGNSIRIDWCGIKWYGSKAKGNRKPTRTYIGKPKGSYAYTLSKLKALARDWEAFKVEETENQLCDIRREASHLVKAIISVRNARLAATRDGKKEGRQ